MSRSLPRTASFALALLAPAVSGQARALLYSPLDTETSGQCVAAPALTEVLGNSVQTVAPHPTATYTSQAYAPRRGYNAICGDFNDDGFYDCVGIFGSIDALLRPRDLLGAPIPLNMRRLFFSPRDRTESCPKGWAFQPADVGRILPSGDLELFLSDAQVRTAFGIAAGQELNVDAAALDKDPARGGILLSFEETQTIQTAATGITTVNDGAVLRIPIGAIAFVASPYDGAAVVNAVGANSGEIVMREVHVDNRVVASGVADNTGANPNAIADTDGLTFDPNGGGAFFRTPFGTVVRHFLFSGESLTGGGVLTTRGGGQIAQLNGVALASNAVTTGQQVGLIGSAVGSLDGLVTDREAACELTTDTRTPTLIGGGSAVAEVGGAPAGAATWMLWGLGVGRCGVDPSIAFANPCFPEFYPFLVGNPVAIGADGCGQDTIVLPPGAYHVTAQAVTISAAGTIHLSTPSVIDIRP